MVSAVGAAMGACAESGSVSSRPWTPATPPSILQRPRPRACAADRWCAGYARARLGTHGRRARSPDAGPSTAQNRTEGKPLLRSSRASPRAWLLHSRQAASSRAAPAPGHPELERGADRASHRGDGRRPGRRGGPVLDLPGLIAGHSAGHMTRTESPSLQTSSSNSPSLSPSPPGCVESRGGRASRQSACPPAPALCAPLAAALLSDDSEQPALVVGWAYERAVLRHGRGKPAKPAVAVYVVREGESPRRQRGPGPV